MINVAVVGAGMMGKNHIRAYNSIKNCNISAICDKNPNVMELGNEYGCNVYSSVEDMIKNEDIDCVSVAVSTNEHYSVGTLLLKKGISTLIEKPISSTLEEAEKLVETAANNNSVLTVGHVERFNPAVQKLNEIRDTLGKIRFVSATRANPFTRKQSCGVTLDLTIHEIDIIRNLLGCEPQNVFAFTKSGMKTEFDDFSQIIFNFGESIATINSNCISPKKIRELIVVGEDKLARLDYINQELILESQDRIEYRDYVDLIKKSLELDKKRIEINKAEPLKLELEHFIECHKNRSKPLVSGNDGLVALKYALAALDSAKQRRLIAL